MSEGRYRHAVVPLEFRGSAALFVAGGYVARGKSKGR